MEWAAQKINLEHLMDVVERKQTKLRWKHVKLNARTKMSVKRAVEVCSEEVVADICQAKLFTIMNNSTEVAPSSFRELVKILIWFKQWYNEIKITMPEKGQCKAHWKKFITDRTYKDLIRSIRAFLGLVQYFQMNHPNVVIIPKTMCQDDVENYFSLQRARISSGHATVLQYFESNSTSNTNLLLTSEFGELKENIGSYDPLCIPNAVKLPLLRRNKVYSTSDHSAKHCSEFNKSSDTFLPLTVASNTYDHAQKLTLLRHAKQTLEYIDLSTSSTIIQVNQIIVQAMKREVNSTHLLDFISCLDNGLHVNYFQGDNWNENSLTSALRAVKKDNNLMVLWNIMLRKMHVSVMTNDLASDLLFLFVQKFVKRRCVIYLAIDGLGPSANNDNLAIRQLLKKYDMLDKGNCKSVRESLNKSDSKCHGCGQLGHWVRECPKGYNKDWLTKQQCFKSHQHGHFRWDCPFKSSSTTTKTTSVPNESKGSISYQGTTALPKIIGMLDSFDLQKSENYVSLNANNSQSVPHKTKQRSDEWFKIRRGKINGSKASVCLGWFGKPVMESYWSSLKQGKETMNNKPEISNKDQIAMQWGLMCENSALATYISKFLGKKYPKSKVNETGVHLINDDNGFPWLASSPDGLVEIGEGSNSLGVLEIKCPFMEGKPFPYRSVCAYHIPQIMLEMHCTNTKWCHYVVWTPVGYQIYLVERDDQYIADLLNYLKAFWNSSQEENGTMPSWQADAFNLKKRAEEFAKNCEKLSSGHSVRDENILEHQFLDLFWNHEDKTDHTPVSKRKCGGCKEEEWKCKQNPCEIRLERLRKKRNIVDNEKHFYQSYTWGSGGLGNSCHQDTILEFFLPCV